MKKKVLIALGSIIGLLFILMVTVGSKDEKEILIETKAKFGSFKIEVNTTGELEAENSEKIGKLDLLYQKIMEII